ncbi:MAG: hypothetical protein K2F64_04090 [Muribaculaceae bacterium]|nr:hypothetical protein [Muribaculaceae bacterium]
MATKKNSPKDGISIANIISIIGVIAFGLLWGLSIAYTTFNMTQAILGALMASALATLFLVLAIRFKQKESADPKWKVAEYICLGCLVALCLYSTPMYSHMTGIQSKKKELKEVAATDIDNVKKEIAKFQSTEEELLNATVTGLSDALNSSDLKSAELKNYMERNSISGSSSVDAFREDKNDIINNITVRATGGGSVSYASAWKKSLDKAEGYINSWNAFRIPLGVNDIKNVNEEAAVVLPRMAEELGFPEIQHQNSVYLLSDTPGISDYNVSLKFTQAMNDVEFFNPTGLALTILVTLNVAFNYMVAPGSRRLGMSKTKNANLGTVL